MIAILDYATSRAADYKKAFESIGAPAAIVNSLDRLEAAHQILLPPCDSFPQAVRSIRDRGLISAIFRAVDDGRPVLGVAQGAHLLFDVSYEDGQHTGLGLFPGKVTGFQFTGQPIASAADRIHRGWSSIQSDANHALLDGIPPDAQFYFDHAFFAEPLDEQLVAATCFHGVQFPTLVGHGNLQAVEFLPEKSGDVGRQFLKNFAAN